jgi:hypothetical protein
MVDTLVATGANNSVGLRLEVNHARLSLEHCIEGFNQGLSFVVHPFLDFGLEFLFDCISKRKKLHSFPN